MGNIFYTILEILFPSLCRHTQAAEKPNRSHKPNTGGMAPSKTTKKHSRKHFRSHGDIGDEPGPSKWPSQIYLWWCVRFHFASCSFAARDSCGKWPFLQLFLTMFLTNSSIVTSTIFQCSIDPAMINLPQRQVWPSQKTFTYSREL